MISDFGECNMNNFKIRDVIKKNNIACLNPGKVARPDDKVECEFIPDCTEENLAFSSWLICTNSDEGFFEERQIQKKNEDTNCRINYQVFPIKRTCQPSVSQSTVVLKDFTTQVDPSNKAVPYKPSRDNLLLEFKGQFKSIKLITTATTSYKIPEYYYFQFELNEEIPRTIGAGKVRYNRLNLTDYGVFKGTETPVKREFDLANVKAANIETAGSNQIDYVYRINNRKSNQIYGSLYVGNGDSMIKEDPKSRIFATINEAILEYECKSGTGCMIQALN